MRGHTAVEIIGDAAIQAPVRTFEHIDESREKLGMRPPQASPYPQGPCPEGVSKVLTCYDLSLSRLNHRLPRGQTHPEIMQGTAEFHHQITNSLLPQADAVFHDATPLDTAVDVLDPEPPLVECLVGPLLLQGQLPTAGLLRRHQDRHLREREGQEAQIL